ncbi:MAG: hypothetical protein NZ898_12195 [Myxococcota bacterium]|nr:hypothetical protein [Myxococcota bacterium]
MRAVVPLWVVLTVIGSGAVARAQAGSDPLLRWHTLRTRHFEVTFHEPLEPVARRVAAIAERAHATLQRVFGHVPRERTRILLTDDSDGANGSASVVPYNAIRLFATAPEDLSPLADHDDWLTELVVHEHAHVLHLDTIGGLPAILNAIFGKIYPPNAVQPRFLIEGIAVHEESARTAGGRLRSTMFDMFLRIAALEGRLLRLDQAASGVDLWPYGQVPYLYGSAFVAFVAERHGLRAIAAVSHDYGDDFIPYGLNRTFRRATGRTLEALWDEFLESVRQRARRTAERVRSEGVVEGTPLTRHGHEARSPRWLDANTVVYWTADGRSAGQLWELDLHTLRRTALVTLGGIVHAAPRPDRRALIASAVENHRDRYWFNDLFHVDLDTGETAQLTSGLRAQEPDFAPDGRRIVFTVNRASTTHLVLADAADVEGTMRILLRMAPFEQVYTPRFSPDGRTVAVSIWQAGGWRDIALVDVETGRLHRVTHDRAIDQGPAWSPDGRHLWFSSDRTGIANLYVHDLHTGTTWQVTNVLSGAYSPAVSPDGRTVVYVGYGPDGFDLYRLPVEPARWRPARPFHDDRPPPADDPGRVGTPLQPYDPLETLLPRAWRLELYSDGFGPSVASRVDGGDLAGWHTYGLRISTGLVRGQVGFDLGWTVHRAPLPVHLRLWSDEEPLGGLVVGGRSRNWIGRTHGGELGVTVPLARANHQESVSFAWTATHTGKAEPFGGALDPNEPPPRLPVTGWNATARTGWFWSDAARHALDFTTSDGRTLSFDLVASHPLLGGRDPAITASWALARYMRNPLVDRHIVALRYAGGTSAGRRRAGFAVGGFPELPLLANPLQPTVLGGVALRGYRPAHRVGPHFHLLQLEYRVPLVSVRRGVGLLPAYVDRLWGLVFFDWGDAYAGRLDLETFRAGTGAELHLDLTLGYFLPFSVRTGLAQGLSSGGLLQWYAHLGVPF